MLRDSDFSVSHFKTLYTADTFEAVTWRIYVSRHFKRKRMNFTCLCIKIKGYVKKSGSALHLTRCHVINADGIPLFIFPVSQ